MLQGTLTAIITPFTDGQIDYARLDANIAFQIENGIDGLVPMGTTGESPTLSHQEHRQVVQHVVKAAAGKVKVVAGAGSNSTAETIDLTEHAKATGADAALLVNPYYNKPSQEGLYRHFSTVAEKVDIPIVLYNIPGRTGVALTPQTVGRLAKHNNIIAIKEATGSLDSASEIASLCDMTILSGDDSLTLPLMSIGGKGVVSVLSNLMPAQVKKMVTAGLNGDFSAARQMHLKLFPLFKACLTLDTNPIPIKTAMALTGKDSGEMRLPLCEMASPARQQLIQTLKNAGFNVY